MSEDLIETFPTGAIARRGPDKSFFSGDLNSQAVFDILAADGKRLRGAPGMAPETTRLEIATEFLGADDPEYREELASTDAGFEVPDAATLWFGQRLFLRGRALPLTGDEALNLSGTLFLE